MRMPAYFFESPQTYPEIGCESYDGGHGGIETRTVRATADIDWLRDRPVMPVKIRNNGVCQFTEAVFPFCLKPYPLTAPCQISLNKDPASLMLHSSKNQYQV